VPTRPLQKSVLTALLALILPASLPAQEAGYWRAASTTARGITGDISFATEKLTINILVITVSRIRALTADEIAAAFNPDPAPQGSSPQGLGSLYRVDIRATQKFLHKNTLCGSDDTKWMATYVSGRSLSLAFFSDDKPPTLTREALNDSTTLCGTFSYSR
jgi:hypothetical protein